MTAKKNTVSQDIKLLKMWLGRVEERLNKLEGKDRQEIGFIQLSRLSNPDKTEDYNESEEIEYPCKKRTR